MSQSSREKNAQDNALQRKCRIPQRLGSGKHRPLPRCKDNRLASAENGRKTRQESIITDENFIIASLNECHEPSQPSASEQKIPSEHCVNHEEFSSDRQVYKTNQFDLTRIQFVSPIEIKQDWKVKREQFEKMRDDLKEKQMTIMEVYADLKTAEEKLTLVGHHISHPVMDDDLRIMNVGKLTPQQLLQLCEATKACHEDSLGKDDFIEQSQKEFNKELTDSIKKNTQKIEKHSEEKMKLHKDKEELEKRFFNMYKKYNETIHNLKIEVSVSARKVVDMEKKYINELDEKTKLQITTQTLQSQLLKKDDRHKDTLKQLHETEAKLSETEKEIERLNKKISEQHNVLENTQKTLGSTKIIEGELRSEIDIKTKHFEDLQKEYLLLEDKTNKIELKMQLYEKQLMTLNGYIKTLKDKYGEHEHLNEVNNTITEENQKLLEVNQRDDELSKALHVQTMDLKVCMNTISVLETHIKERDELLKKLYEKEKEQTNTIEFLKRSLTSKNNENFIEKDPEFRSSSVDIGRKEKRIFQLEKVLIALYEQARKTKLKNKKYQEKNYILKQVISEYETYINNINVDSSSEHLNSIIQIFENEIESGSLPVFR